jgi:hypothetical protein
MLTPTESRAALQLVASDAVADVTILAGRLSGSPDTQRLALLDAVPAVIGYYADGSSALAADFYDDQRSLAGVRSPYSAQPVVKDRTEKIRNAVAWSAAPLFEPLPVTVGQRLAEVVQYEVARPFRDTITTNRRSDKECVGWQRVSTGGCKFCAMLAANDAVYSQAGASFAAHPNCTCSAVPVFMGGRRGPEASVMQYRASSRGRSQKQRDQLRDYLNTYFSDFPG